MSIVKLKYEILISGVYPFQGEFEKEGFKLIKNKLDENVTNDIMEYGTIYISPFLGFCVYPDSEGSNVYLTFEKNKDIEIDYPDGLEYSREITNEYLEKFNLLEEVENLEKMMILETNNNIKFPIKIINAFDTAGKKVATIGDIMNINIPSLLANDKNAAFETIKRQTNRLSSVFAYEKIIELKNNNEYFNNAFTTYYSSFSVIDNNVSFILLVTSLESLLSKSTYKEIENCKACGQPQYKLRATIAENVGSVLMNMDKEFLKELKKKYDKRSSFVHSGKQNITTDDKQILQEYVRKVLLMYWYVSLNKNTYVHEEIIAELLSGHYQQNMVYQQFLIALDNTSFEEKKANILKRFFDMKQ